MRTRNLAVLTSMSFMLVACSGQNGSGLGSAGGFGSSIQSQFIDAPVKGLSFVSDSNPTGKTENEGKFSCSRGEIVEFKLGVRSLGKASCGDKIFVQDLVGTDTGYTWQKAAALIQSFSVAGAGVLDLSQVTIPDLTSLTYNHGSFDSELSDKVDLAVVPSGVTPPSVVIPSAASTAANSSLNTYATVSDDVQAVFTAFGANRKLYGKLSAGASSKCWYGFTASATIAKTGSVNKLTVNSAISFDDSSYVPNDICSTQSEDIGECENVASQYLPTGRTLTSSNISIMYNDQNDQVSSLVLSPGLSSDGVAVVGTLVSSYEDDDSSIVSCKYDITSTPVVIVDDNEGSEDGDDSDGTGTFEGALACHDSVEDEDFELHVQAIIKLDSDAAEGYTIDLDIKDDEDVNLYTETGIELVNDIETPDDTPFLDYDFSVVDGGVTVPFSITGYNEWDEDGYRITSLSSTSIQCTNTVLPRAGSRKK